MTRSAPFTWILFDAVGTLMHPSPSVAEAYWTIGRQFGSRLTVSEVEERFRREFSRSFSSDPGAEMTSSEQIERERWQQIVERVLEDVHDRTQCFAEVHRHFSQPSAWKLFVDVPGVLHQLRQAGYRLAIASNFDHRLHDVAAGHEELRRFTAVLTSAELGYRKPSDQFYAELSRRLQASPEEMLMVGDHPVNDVEAARTAGLRAVLIDRENQYEDELERIPDLGLLLDHLSSDSLSRGN